MLLPLTTDPNLNVNPDAPRGHLSAPSICIYLHLSAPRGHLSAPSICIYLHLSASICIYLLRGAIYLLFSVGCHGVGMVGWDVIVSAW